MAAVPLALPHPVTLGSPQLRDAGPLVWVELPGGIHAAAITSRHLIQEALRRLSKDPGSWRTWGDGHVPGGLQLAPWLTVPAMLTLGDADQRIRQRARQVLAEQPHPNLRHRARTITTTALADLSQREPVELKGALRPLVLQVMLDLLGLSDIPTSHREELTRWWTQASHPADADEAIAAHDGLSTTLTPLITQRQKHPGEDLISILTRPSPNDEDLTIDEAVELVTLILSGGAITLDLLTNCVLALLLHPDQLHAIHSGRATWGEAMEETLRWMPPITSLPHYRTTSELALADVRIPAGQRVLLCIAAANRDPHRHANADSYRVARDNQSHAAFGYATRCPGAPLARLMTRTILAELCTHHPRMQLAVDAGQLQLPHSLVCNSPDRLPVLLGDAD